MKRSLEKINKKVSLQHDWCHLCGHREEQFFIEFSVPENAEHSVKDGYRGYFRFCDTCVGYLQQTLSVAKFAGINNKGTFKPLWR